MKASLQSGKVAWAMKAAPTKEAAFIVNKVEVIGRHANPVHPEKSVEELEALLARLQRSHPNRPALESTPPRSPQRRLSADQLVKMATAYTSGISTNSLAATYGLSKGSVLKLPAQQDVAMRRQPPTSAQVEKAATLYERGSSLASISAALGLSQTALRRHLGAAGVTLRSRGGSKARSRPAD